MFSPHPRPDAPSEAVMLLDRVIGKPFDALAVRERGPIILCSAMV